MLTACGSDKSEVVAEKAADTEQSEVPAEDTGKVVVIHTSGEELQQRMEQLYPAYERTGTASSVMGLCLLLCFFCIPEGNIRTAP